MRFLSCVIAGSARIFTSPGSRRGSGAPSSSHVAPWSELRMRMFVMRRLLPSCESLIWVVLHGILAEVELGLGLHCDGATRLMQRGERGGGDGVVLEEDARGWCRIAL